MGSTDKNTPCAAKLKSNKLSKGTLNDSEALDDLEIKTADLEAYFKANILLQYGILGYIGFRFKILEFYKHMGFFVVETSAEYLSKLQLIVLNRFPAKCPIDFTQQILNCEADLKFRILKHDNSLSALINDDLLLNTS